MHAWQVMEYGHFRDVLQWNEVATPEPGPGQALLQIKAAGISFALMLRIAGKYQIRDDPPYVPGQEISGVVVAKGPGSSFEVGQRVMANVNGGGFAEYALVDDSNAYPQPDEMPFTHAAAFLNAYQTAYIGLVPHAGLKAGEVVLVHGAAGAVGMATVQVAKALGATVIATAGSDAKVKFCLELGADHAINYSTEDFPERVNEITGGRGADLIYDPVGGDVFDKSRRCIAFRGRIVVVGFTSGRISEIGVNRMLLRNFAVTGFTLHGYQHNAPEEMEACRAALMELYRAGKVTPAISHELPITQLPDALALLEDRMSLGKVVVVPE